MSLTFKAMTSKVNYSPRIVLMLVIALLLIGNVFAVDANCVTGGTTYDIGNFRYHRFDTNTTITINKTCFIDLLLVGGGGAGGSKSNLASGGGGGGGLIYKSNYRIYPGNYDIVIGSGGINDSNGRGKNGQNTSFNGLIALGGGGGGAQSENINGLNGGSGGGGAGYGGGSGGLGSQGFNGGSGPNGGTNYSGGGGGGAGENGHIGNLYIGGNGGNGLLLDINGTSVYYAGGGGGGSYGTTPSLGGLGGGGNGAGFGNTAARNGIPNTGGGGGGGKSDITTPYGGASGGSGVVIMKYDLTQTTPPTTTISGCTSGWHGTNQTITLTCNGNGSTCLDTNYTIDGGAITKYTAPFTPNLDKNFIITYFSNSDYPALEATKTFYCAVDKTYPVLGITKTDANTGFRIYGSYITGTGSISATVNNDISGIASCYYSINNGVNWLIADMNATHCYKNNISLIDNTYYTFNFKATSNAGLTKTGTATIEYIADLTPPLTTFSSYQLSGTTSQSITLTCTDNNSGCKYINFRINNGDWNYYTIGDNPLTIIYNGAGSHSIQYFSTDNSDNNESIKTSYFTTYGKGRFYFKDENSGSDLTGVQVNFNGTDYDSGANNYLDFNFQTFPSTNTTYLFTLSKTGYSTRYYQTDLNYFSDFNTTFALLPESLATDLQFKMFPPTGTTTLANTYIEFKDKDTNYTITRLKSNSEGELTANLRSDDQNYLVWISEGTYIYQAVQLTILYPKDEQTLSNITGNWRIEITDNISYQDLNIPEGTSKIIYLLPNTKYPFTIAVQDVAGTYFKRKWSKIYPGNPLTDTLQPYLVNADDGIAVKFVFQDPKRDSIENIIINIYKNVGGVKTLISSGASDVTGNALFFLIAGEKYMLDFTYNGAVIFETQNYSVTSSTVYWTINLATREIKTIDGKFITVGFNPIQDYILKNATNISYKVTASGLNRTRAEFYIIQDGNKIITYTRDAPCTTPCTVTIPIEDLNITLGNKVYLDLNVYIDSNNYIFNYKKTWSYGTTSNIDTHDLFVKARTDFGCTTDTMWPCPLTSIVSIIIMILLIGSMVFTFNFVNPKGLLVAGLGILAVFTYLGWFWWVALVLIIIASIFYLRGD